MGEAALSPTDVYRQWASDTKALPLFLEPWWLDAACNHSEWEAACVHKGDRIVAAMPYARARRYGLDYRVTPPFCQHVGPWLDIPTSGKTVSRIAKSLSLLQELIQVLPTADLVSVRLSGEIPNLSPFFWHGFTLRTRYTYVLESLQDENTLWANLRDNIRNKIRKARREVHLTDSLEADRFVDVHSKTFERQGIDSPAPHIIRNLVQESVRRGRGFVLGAEDSVRRLHAACFVAWDAETAFYIMSGADPDLRSSGAQALLLWEAICRSRAVVDRFDFEGSMIPEVEQFVRGFGGSPHPLTLVRRLGRRMRILSTTREWLDSVIGRPQRPAW